MKISIALSLIVLVIVFLLSCKSKGIKASNDVDSTTLAFNEFTKEISKVVLPAKYWCGLHGIGRPKDELKAYAKFIPKNADGIFGKIESDRQDFTFIIYASIGDILYPSLYSYGVDGKVIDSIGLGRGCAGDDRLILSTHFTIGNDMKITVLDSSRWIHYPDDAGDYVLDSIVVDRNVHTINKAGQFVKE